MKRSGVLILLISVLTACAITVAVLIARTPGANPIASYFASAGEAYDGIMAQGAEIADATPQADAQATEAAAAQSTPDAAQTAAPENTAQPDAQVTEAATESATEATAVDQTSQAEPSATAQAIPAAVLPTAAAGETLAVSTGEAFGTPEELNEATPKFNYSALSLKTGLDEETLAKMYSPFYVLDIDMDEVYYPLKSPGGSAGSNKIYGGQVGVNVVSIDGDYAYITAYRYPGGRAIEGYVPVSKLKLVTPDDRYSIIVDKRQQKLFFFEYGELVEEMYCSTGKTTTETPAGEFLKYGTKKTIYSDAADDVAYWGTHINGRVYIHSVSEVHGDYSTSISMLGRKASHGCIRVPLEWAEWFYKNLPDGTKVVITEYRGDTPPLGTGGRDGD